MTGAFLGMLTFFAAVVAASVMLIQIGGWLPILVAVFLICGYFGQIIFVILTAMAFDRLKKKEEEKKE